MHVVLIFYVLDPDLVVVRVDILKEIVVYVLCLGLRSSVLMGFLVLNDVVAPGAVQIVATLAL